MSNSRSTGKSGPPPHFIWPARAHRNNHILITRTSMMTFHCNGLFDLVLTFKSFANPCKRFYTKRLLILTKLIFVKFSFFVRKKGLCSLPLCGFEDCCQLTLTALEATATSTMTMWNVTQSERVGEVPSDIEAEDHFARVLCQIFPAHLHFMFQSTV